MIYVKLALGVAVLIVLLALGEHFYRQAYTAGAQSVQVKWDAQLADVHRVADEAIERAIKAKDEALANNEVIRANYETQLTAAQSDAADFAERLRNAYSHPRAVPKSGSGQGTTAAVPAAGDDRLTGLLAGAAAECLQNATQLDALTAELKPQL